MGMFLHPKYLVQPWLKDFPDWVRAALDKSEMLLIGGGEDHLASVKFLLPGKHIFNDRLHAVCQADNDSDEAIGAAIQKAYQSLARAIWENL